MFELSSTATLLAVGGGAYAIYISLALSKLIAGKPPSNAPKVHSGLRGLTNPQSIAERDGVYPEDLYEGGAEVSLPNGRIQYWLFGPEDGKKVVLVHGFSMPSLIWKEVAQGFAKSGYRVLLFDHYGRGYSEAPETPYNQALYTTTLALLFQHVGWTKASVVGLSMGGAIVAQFHRFFPQLCDKVVLIASAGVMDLKGTFAYFRYLSPPAIAKYSSILRKSTPATMPTGPDVHHGVRSLAKVVQLQTHLPNYWYAIISTLREGIFYDSLDAFKSLAGKQVLAIWGTADSTVPYECAARIKRVVPDMELVTLEDAEHDIVVTHSQEVLDALRNFL